MLQAIRYVGSPSQVAVGPFTCIGTLVDVICMPGGAVTSIRSDVACVAG
jgi:hypothetical protein